MNTVLLLMFSHQFILEEDQGPTTWQISMYLESVRLDIFAPATFTNQNDSEGEGTSLAVAFTQSVWLFSLSHVIKDQT